MLEISCHDSYYVLVNVILVIFAYVPTLKDSFNTFLFDEFSYSYWYNIPGFMFLCGIKRSKMI